MYTRIYMRLFDFFMYSMSNAHKMWRCGVCGRMGECQKDLESSALKCWTVESWNVENVEMLKVEDVAKLKKQHNLHRETVYFQHFQHFQWFNLSTFQHFQHFQLSTFQHVNFPYRIQIWMFNLTMLNRWKVESSNVEKRWKVEQLKAEQVEMLKVANVEDLKMADIDKIWYWFPAEIGK